MTDNPKIFIANHLPVVTASPLKNPVLISNFLLQQAVWSVARALRGGVFELSLFEHFTASSNGKPLALSHKYFAETGQLTQLGCLILRECICRETEIKGYWFKERPHPAAQ